MPFAVGPCREGDAVRPHRWHSAPRIASARVAIIVGTNTRAIGWIEEEVDSWIARRIALRDAVALGKTEQIEA